MTDLLKFWKIQSYSPEEFFAKVCNAEDEKVITKKYGNSLIKLFSKLKGVTSERLSDKDNKVINKVFSFLEMNI